MNSPLFTRDDAWPLALVAALPLLVALPLLLGWLAADPLLYRADLALELERGPLRGTPYADPNNGYTTLALGYRAALDWLQGSVPWWNPYSGVGLPLAAEYQPAAFFPLTFLLLLQKGTVVLQVVLQIVAGAGTYGLLRHLGTTRLAATAGAILFAFNGTLAWFAHAPATAVPFLPWMLWGIERIHAGMADVVGPRWRLFAAAMAMSLLAGFPETAYINGLLALAWSILRGFQLERPMRLAYAARVALGGMTGIAIASPQVLAFFMYLPEASIGGHAHAFAHAALMPMAVLSTLVAPYAYGPIGAYLPSQAFHDMWGGAGGYVTIVLIAAAIYGAAVRRGALTGLLLGWTAVVLGKTWAVEPFLTLVNLVPGVTAAAFARYAHPSWTLALGLLAAFAIDDIVRFGARRRPALLATALALALAAAASIHLPALWPELGRAAGLRNSTVASLAWAALTLIAFAAFTARRRMAHAARALVALLVIDAMLMYAVPTMSNPRRGSLDVAAIDFLRANLGLQRFYSLEPFQPNFGAYFGLASINHNYVPVARRWIAWIRRHIDPALPDDAVFNGNSPGAASRLLANLEPYRALGVKYVIAPAHSEGFVGWPAQVGELRRVYLSRKLAIYELPAASPYFDVGSAPCTATAAGRLAVSIDCKAPATLVRRELNFPGWRVTVNGSKAPLLGHDDLFQAVALPQGKSEVRFRYAPPKSDWGWAALALGLLALGWRRRASGFGGTRPR